MTSELHYGLVGHGRLATHLAHYFRLKDILFTQWSRKYSQDSVSESLNSCDTILLAIKDDAIESFIQEHSFLRQKTVVHFSGLLTLPHVHCAHPLMTFGPQVYPALIYEEMAFVTEKGKKNFHQLFPGLQNRAFAIAPEKKSLYHAYCVIGGNFTTLLWNHFFQKLEHEFQIPREAAFPYLHQITANLLENAEKALTGPFQRRDFKTITKHFEALEADDALHLYHAFCDLFFKHEVGVKRQNECIGL